MRRCLVLLPSCQPGPSFSVRHPPLSHPVDRELSPARQFSDRPGLRAEHPCPGRLSGPCSTDHPLSPPQIAQSAPAEMAVANTAPSIAFAKAIPARSPLSPGRHASLVSRLRRSIQSTAPDLILQRDPMLAAGSQASAQHWSPERKDSIHGQNLGTRRDAAT